MIKDDKSTATALTPILMHFETQDVEEYGNTITAGTFNTRKIQEEFTHKEKEKYCVTLGVQDLGNKVEGAREYQHIIVLDEDYMGYKNCRQKCFKIFRTKNAKCSTKMRSR